MRLKKWLSLIITTFFLHLLMMQPISWLMLFGWHFFLVVFRVKTKFDKIWNSRYLIPERGSSGSLWYALYISKYLNNYFSYNKKLKGEKNVYNFLTDVQHILKKWKMRKLTLGGKIVVFKTIAISKTVFQSFITTVSKHIVNELTKMKIQKTFSGINSFPNIKYEPLCNNYKLYWYSKQNYNSSMFLDKKTLW